MSFVIIITIENRNFHIIFISMTNIIEVSGSKHFNVTFASLG